jgi:sugar phosphate isomerase/epimerase
MRSDVLISLSSFGAGEVRRHGQLWFAQLAREAGADGVEVRGELLRDDAEAEVEAIGAAFAGSGIALVHSSPEPLWQEDGLFDDAALRRGLDLAKRLGAPHLKMSIGSFRAPSQAGFAALQERLHGSGIELLIENDQTESAGTLPALQAFFGAARAAGVPLAMTFDMGNWHWTGECPLRAAEALGDKVGYVHCKGVQRQPQRWVAVPLAESAAPWRAVLRALPAGVPAAIEYPLVGDDLLAVTRAQVESLRRLRSSRGDAR